MQFEKVFNNGIIYNFFQKAIHNKKADESIKDFFILPSAAKLAVCVLDIGCGPGTWVPYLLGTDYTGIDINEGNILLAKKKYANFHNIKLITGDVREYFCNQYNAENTFDIIFMRGVLHHLSKDIICSILPVILKLIKKNGVFRSCDPVYTKEQPGISKWVMSHDRGKYILELDDYLKLVKTYFPVVKYKIETDLLRFPFPYPAIKCWGYLS